MKTFLNTTIIASCLLLPHLAQASFLELSYFRITSNNTEDVAGQLRTQVRDQTRASSDFGISIDSDEVLFTFHNDATIASNIAEIYFDDGVIFNQTSITNSINGFTSFDDGGNNGINPGNLPNSNAVNPEFQATADFGADVLNGNPNKGIDESSDILGIVIKLFPDLNFFDLHTALYDGDLRLGLHVRSIGAQDGSDSFVNTPALEPAAAVPVPAAFWLFGSAVLMLTRYRKSNIN